MKKSLCLAACLLTATAAFAADPPQFQIEASFASFTLEKLDPALVHKLDPGAKLPPSDQDILAAPRVTTRAGQRATIEIIREVPVPGGTEDGKSTVNSGVTLDVTPAFKDDKITLAGRSTVRHRLEPGGKQPLGAVSFDTRETFFSGEVTDGKPLTIQTGNGVGDTAQVTLTVTRVQPAGKLHASHDGPPKYRVYAIEPSPEEAKKPIYKTLGVLDAKTADGDSLPQSDLAVAGVFQPADESNSMLRQVEDSLRELPSAEQPLTISSVLGQDGQTLDWKIQSQATSAHPASTELSTWWGSDIYLTMADPARSGGRRGLLIRQEE